SDAYNDELPYWVRVGDKPHLVVPYSLVTNDVKFGRNVFGPGDDFFAFLRDSFDLLYEEGAERPRLMSIGLHMRLSGHPGRAMGLRRFIDHIAARDRVWVCRREDIARHWIAQFPPECRRRPSAGRGYRAGSEPWAAHGSAGTIETAGGNEVGDGVAPHRHRQPVGVHDPAL